MKYQNLEKKIRKRVLEKESARKETFAAAHGQNKERAVPLRSD